VGERLSGSYTGNGITSYNSESYSSIGDSSLYSGESDSRRNSSEESKFESSRKISLGASYVSVLLSFSNDSSKFDYRTIESWNKCRKGVSTTFYV